MSDQVKENLSNTSHWLRLLLTVLYALIFWLGVWVLGFVVVLNLVILLISGERNQQLADFGGQVSRYLGQIMAYATQNTDDQPFPFGEWPQSEAPADSPAAEPEPAPKPRKKTARKKTGKKKVSKKPADDS
ncbi:MAG: DUF4389 domain-containing protein [Xanthomonadales bacterium]|nr:DUF4389 domain-containing protein [Xanthomonadales bacterium]